MNPREGMERQGAPRAIYFTLFMALFMSMGRLAGRVIITLYALKLGAQPLTVGVLAALTEVLPTLFSWHVGRLSDRFGSRWLLLVGATGGILGMLVSYAVPGLPALFVTSAMFGLHSALYGAPVQNLVGLQSRPENRARNYSNLSLVVSFTGFASPLLAGFSIDHAGADMACLLLALLLAIPAAMLMIWGGLLPSGTQTSMSRGSVRTLLSESGLWRVLATSSLVVMGVEFFQVFMPIYGNGFGLSASAIGVVLAIFSSAAFVVRFFLSSLVKRLTVERLLANSFLVGAAGLLLVPLFKNFAILCAVSFFFGLGMGCGQPITMMMTFSSSSRGRSGEAMGLRITVNDLTRVVGQVFFGFIGSTFGIFSVFWVNAVMLVSGWAASRPGTAEPQKES